MTARAHSLRCGLGTPAGTPPRVDDVFLLSSDALIVRDPNI